MRTDHIAALASWIVLGAVTTAGCGGGGGGGGGGGAPPPPVTTATVSFVAPSSTLTEGTSQTLEVELSLTPSTARLGAPITVALQVQGGSTALGVDYVLPATVTFPAGAASGRRRSFSMGAVDDALVEGPETAALLLAPTPGVQTGTPSTHTATILDADAATIAFASPIGVTLAETGSHPVTVVLTTTGGAALTRDVSVQLTSAPGSATGGVDYADLVTTVTFPLGSSDGDTQQPSVTLLADSLIEGEETFVLTLSGVSAPAVLGLETTHAVDISDDQSAVLQFERASSAAPEASAGHDVVVRLTAPNGGTLAAPLSATVASADSSATAAVDYAAGGAQVTFPAGAGDGATQVVTASIIADTLIEGDEALTLTLSSPSLGSIGAPSSHSLTITDDDLVAIEFTLAASATAATAGETPTSHPVTVRLITSPGGTLATDLTCTVTSGGGTATAGSDYTAVSTLLTFPTGAGDGATSTVSLPVLHDLAMEAHETVVLTLSGVSAPGSLGAVTSHTVTIHDDDSYVYFAGTTTPTPDESAGPHPVTLTIRTGPDGLAADVTLGINSSNGTATGGADYAAITSALVIFPAGSGNLTTRTIDVSVLPDTAREGDESLTLTIMTAVGPASIATPTHTVRITDDDLAWQPVNVGLDGGACHALAIDPATPTTVYAGGLSSRAGVYKSTDGGVTWSPSGVGLPGGVEALAIDPSSPDVLYAVAIGGIFKSTNGGATWITTALPFGFMTNNRVKSLALDPTSPGRVLVGQFSVFRTINGGLTWASAVFPSGVLPTFMHALVLDPTNPSTVYAATSTAGIFKSVDGGATFSAINTGLGNVTTLGSVLDLAIDPASPGTLYAGTSFRGAFKSTNGGASWSAISAGLPMLVDSLAIDPVTPLTVYAGTSAGVHRSTDGGASWSPAATGVAAASVLDLAVDPTAPARLFAASIDGIARSLDGASTWSDSHTGLQSRRMSAVIVDATTPATVYCADGTTGPFKSQDAGGAWSLSNGGLSGGGRAVLALARDPASPLRIYAGTFDGVWRSDDGGATWTLLGPPGGAFVQVVVIDPIVPANVYLGTSAGAFKSTDAGATWAAISTGLTSLDIEALALDPTTPATLYAGAGSGGGVFKSTDAGASWSASNSGLTSLTVLDLVVDPSTTTRLYAATGNGVFRSLDGAATWSAVNVGLLGPPVVDALAIDPTAPTTVYAATTAGVFKTITGGARWFLANNGLGTLRVQALAVDPTSPDTIYGATFNGGIHKTTTGGQ